MIFSAIHCKAPKPQPVLLIVPEGLEPYEPNVWPDHREWLRRDPCCWCAHAARKGTMSIEHIQPKVHGGRNHWENYANACQTCNLERGSQGMLKYLLFRLGKRC